MQGISVEIFRTNIRNKKMAGRVLSELSRRFPDCEINFDLEDCDNILRVAGSDFNIPELVETVTDLGFFCEILE
ncbi:MAG: hypothetical protein WC384_12255 [Prolixibacteraceae bacterium]|jgi:hypothetical protein